MNAMKRSIDVEQERKRFEDYFGKRGRDLRSYPVGNALVFIDNYTRDLWVGWQARAEQDELSASGEKRSLGSAYIELTEGEFADDEIEKGG